MIYVSMTDNFMSGWGKAKGMRNRFVVECEDREQADIIEANARQRDDMSRIGMSEVRPRQIKGVLYSFTSFDQLGPLWKKGYTRGH